MEKPKNYQPGGQEALNNFGRNNIPQLIFLLLLIVWTFSAVYISITDIFNGFQHPVLTTTFILTSIIGLYLKIRQTLFYKKLFPFVNVEGGCTKCGKNKSK